MDGLGNYLANNYVNSNNKGINKCIASAVKGKTDCDLEPVNNYLDINEKMFKQISVYKKSHEKLKQVMNKLYTCPLVTGAEKESFKHGFSKLAEPGSEIRFITLLLKYVELIRKEHEIYKKKFISLKKQTFRGPYMNGGVFKTPDEKYLLGVIISPLKEQHKKIYPSMGGLKYAKKAVSSAVWESALKKFEDICSKNGVNLDDYPKIYDRKVEPNIHAIINGKFDEKESFLDPEIRNKLINRAREKFLRILAENEIDTKEYAFFFGNEKIQKAAMKIYYDEFDSVKWVIKPTPLSIEEAKIIQEKFFKLKNIEDKIDYQIKYNRLITKLNRAIRKLKSEKIDDYQEYFTYDFSRNPPPTEKEIFESAKKQVPEGRTAGVGYLELGSYLKKMVSNFYRGGLVKLNDDLGLEQIKRVEDFKVIKKDAPTKQEIKLEKINKKLDRLIDQFKPEKFQKLKNELLDAQNIEDDFEIKDIDEELLQKLETSIEKALKVSSGYLYFKQWVLPETTWFKIGKTNSPERRDMEQNVLPVPAQTIFLLKLDSMEQAAAVEKAILSSLAERRILGAQNKELFKLGGGDYKTVLRVLNNLSNKLKKIHLENP